MAYLKAIPNKKSGRLLVAVRNNLLKELKFEEWVLINHPQYYDPDNHILLKHKVQELETRIHRAVIKEHMRKIHQAVLL